MPRLCPRRRERVRPIAAHLQWQGVYLKGFPFLGRQVNIAKTI